MEVLEHILQKLISFCSQFMVHNFSKYTIYQQYSEVNGWGKSTGSAIPAVIGQIWDTGKSFQANFGTLTQSLTTEACWSLTYGGVLPSQLPSAGQDNWWENKNIITSAFNYNHLKQNHPCATSIVATFNRMHLVALPNAKHLPSILLKNVNVVINCSVCCKFAFFHPNQTPCSLANICRGNC